MKLSIKVACSSRLSKLDSGRVIQDTTNTFLSFQKKKKKQATSCFTDESDMGWDAKCSGIVQGAGIFGLLARRSLAGMAPGDEIYSTVHELVSDHV